MIVKVILHKNPPLSCPSNQPQRFSKVPCLAQCGNSFGTSEHPSFVFAACPVDSVPGFFNCLQNCKPSGSIRAICPSCPDFWVRYGEHCYYFSLKKTDWDSSLEFCLAEGSQLLMLTGKQEMSLLQPFLKDDFYWIGLKNNSGWRWEDGSALNFSMVLSNSVVQKCGTFSKNGLLASGCEVLLQWVCKKVYSSVAAVMWLYSRTHVYRRRKQ
ncbi:killer cell lectin-like receptor subfamily G member 1 [Suricata suricatta]|uniref:killer cell lectin-like receptor subfamily G member 1 n=1 Tax=Suricata suricatta TaxID=37032 RepID=UPI001155D25E|nr:killer cell lectin-like receptor subfamily G member 1 [Suricata suricatta]